MYDSIIKKIRKCLPKNLKQYVVHEPFFPKSTLKEIGTCLDSSYVSTSGEYIDRFTDELHEVTNSKYVLLTSSGTAALFCALEEINISGCEVILPSMTFVATPNAIMHAGGIPNFIDNTKTSLNIDAENLDKYLSKNTKQAKGYCINKKTQKRIRCIIVVHAYGHAANISSICKVSKKYNIEVMEDAAGGLGSYESDNHVGTISRMGALSFNGNKIVTTGMGGALLLKNKKDYERISHRISTARIKHDWKVEHDMVGYNLRMANINAALGYSQITNLKRTLKVKRELYNDYREIFHNDNYCYIRDHEPNTANNNWVTNLYLKDSFKDKHQALIKRLHKDNVLVRELWKHMHLLPMFKAMPRTSMKNSINDWKTGFSLPSCYYK